MNLLMLMKLTAASLTDLAWMAGRWQGEAFGSTITEMWTPIEQGNMTGVFRMIRGGKVGLYELMVLETGANGPVLRMKHFNGALVGREEKDRATELALVSAEGRRAVFESKQGDTVVTLVYHSPSMDELVVDYRKAGPKPEQAVFRFQRVKSLP